MITVIAFIVLGLSFFNLVRMAIFMVGSDIYDIRRLSQSKNQSVRKRTSRPLVSVLIPAHNEEAVLQRTMMSVYRSDYSRIELFVINDSSEDRTKAIARNFQRRYGKRFARMTVLNVRVRGKALAMNAALAHVKGSLMMCLDADSSLDPTAISRAVSYFQEDPKLMCATSSVKIYEGRGLLNLLQRVEYMVSTQAKKTEAVANMQYIVGGAGSLFRTRFVKAVGGYDHTTMTEDIDLSMKLLKRYGSRQYKIRHLADVVTMTESVTSFRDLLKQRYRWKYGRYQAFLKNRELFLSRRKDLNKVLSWVYLPYALVGEVLFFLEPIVLGFILFLLLSYGDVAVVAASFGIFSFYVIMHAWGASQGYSGRERLALIAATPVVYFGMFVLSLVEYISTLRGITSLPAIFGWRPHKVTGSSAWKPVKRTGDVSS